MNYDENIIEKIISAKPEHLNLALWITEQLNLLDNIKIQLQLDDKTRLESYEVYTKTIQALDEHIKAVQNDCPHYHLEKKTGPNYNDNITRCMLCGYICLF